MGYILIQRVYLYIQNAAYFRLAYNNLTLKVQARAHTNK